MAIASVVRKELREVLRDGRLWVAAVAMAALLFVALAFGLSETARLARERAAAQTSANEHFASQDEKNPHEAAHYGTYVFKPAGALRFVDPGAEPFVGTSVRLVAHARSAPEGARASDGASLSGLGRLSAATVLQLLVPLLLLVLGFSAWTGEREKGTLRLVLSIGARPRTLFVGKLLGLAASVLCLVLPAALLGAVALALFSEGPVPGARLGLMLAAYTVFLATFLFLAMGVSAVARTSRTALVAVLALWVTVALVLPRVATSAAALAHPLPDPATFDRDVAKTLAEGVPGGPEREARIEELSEVLLEREGFAGAETLMDASLLAGLELQAEAQYENEVLDHHHARLARIFAAREGVVRWFSLAAPPVAMQSTSAALAGTDHAHHRHFSDAAEAHRRALIDMLNRAFAERGGADGWSYKAGRETWERAPKFAYEAPPLAWSLQAQRVPLLALGVWFFGSLAFAAWASARVRLDG